MAEAKNVPSVPATQPQNILNVEGFDDKVKKELIILQNIRALNKRVEGLKGDEAFIYVEAQQYLSEKTELLYQSEMARLTAEKKLEADLKARMAEAEAVKAATKKVKLETVPPAGAKAATKKVKLETVPESPDKEDKSTE